jgi:hypothetical protein
MHGQRGRIGPSQIQGTVRHEVNGPVREYKHVRNVLRARGNRKVDASQGREVHILIKGYHDMSRGCHTGRARGGCVINHLGRGLGQPQIDGS